LLAVRFLPNSLPLEQLNLGNPVLASQPPLFLGTAVLAPDTAAEFQVPLPVIPPGQSLSLILETRLVWETSNNQSDALELFPVTPSLPPAVMSIALLSNGNVVVSWTGNGTLQSAPDVLGPWVNIFTTGQSITLNPTEARRFFRLETSALGN